MKKTMAVAVLVMATLAVNAQQGAGGKGGSQGTGGQRGQGGQSGQQHQRPSPEQMTEQLMTKFDTNKDGKLEQGELTQALTALRAHRPPPGGGQGGQHRGTGEQGGKGQQAAGQDGAKAERPTPPPASEVAAKMIEKFAADKKGLTQSEFAKALADRHNHQGQHGGPGGQHGGGAQGGDTQGGANPAK